MRLTAALAAPSLALALVVAPLTASAQTAAPEGLSITAVTDWIASKGGAVGPVQRDDGSAWVMVQDGGLNWAVFFYGCQADVCGDLQLAASFSNTSITGDLVNEWNRDRRFLKAFYDPAEAAGEDPRAVVQYDILLSDGDADQLTEPVVVWLDLLREFAVHVGYFAPDGAPAAE